MPGNDKIRPWMVKRRKAPGEPGDKGNNTKVNSLSFPTASYVPQATCCRSLQPELQPDTVKKDPWKLYFPSQSLGKGIS